MSGAGVPPPPPPSKSDADLTIVDDKRASLIADRQANGVSSDEDSIDLNKEIYDSTAIDPVLAKKMALANSALDEIGMTGFQWKLFYLNGFGYAVDSVRRCPPHFPTDILTSIFSAPHCLSIHCRSCSDARVWKSEQEDSWCRSSLTGWIAHRCSSLGYES